MAGPNGGRLVVLLVEDDPDHAFILTRGLAGLDAPQVHVEHVGSAAAAVEALAAGSPIDCVLCDLTLPDARGLEALEMVRRAAGDVPIVVLTGNDSDALGVTALQTGAQDYLVKGRVDPALIARSLRFAIERSARARAERSQVAIADRLRLVLEAIAEGICWLDRDGRCTYLNPGAAEIIGYRAGDVAGARWHDLVGCRGPDDECGLEAALSSAEPVDLGDQILTRADGSAIVVEARVRPIFDDDEAAVAGVVVTFTDVTAARRAQTALVNREAQLAEAQRVARLGSFEHDLVTGRVDSSPELGRLLGIPPEQMPHTDALFAAYVTRVPPSERPAVTELLRRAATAGIPVSFQHRLNHPDGTQRWLDCRIEVRNRGSNGHPTKVVGAVQDVTDQKLAEDAVAHAAVHDALTGLANRVLLADRLERALLVARRRAGFVGVIFLDLDRFKLRNDSLSHRVGDQLLVQVAGALSEAIRLPDTLARFGGDEFVVLCEDLRDERAVLDVAERLAAALTRPFNVGDREVRVTASMGIALAGPGTIGDTEGLLRDADAAMYRAKEAGRGRYEVFDARMRAAVRSRMDTEQALRSALDRDEITVFYQPIVDLMTQSVVAVEALARWSHPQHGIRDPASFIPIAEETGMIEELGRRVLDLSCRTVVDWNRTRGAVPLWLSVNLSPRQLNRANSDRALLDTASRSGLAPHLLCLEITESLLLADDPVIHAALNSLRQDGVMLAIDDFGTGYSSLAYLQRLDVDILKIDRSFVDGLDRDPDRLAIVTAVVRLADALRLRVIAEGSRTARSSRSCWPSTWRSRRATCWAARRPRPRSTGCARPRAAWSRPPSLSRATPEPMSGRHSQAKGADRCSPRRPRST